MPDVGVYTELMEDRIPPATQHYLGRMENYCDAIEALR